MQPLRYHSVVTEVYEIVLFFFVVDSLVMVGVSCEERLQSKTIATAAALVDESSVARRTTLRVEKLFHTAVWMPMLQLKLKVEKELSTSRSQLGHLVTAGILLFASLV
jgi:hypothetical protein